MTVNSINNNVRVYVGKKMNEYIKWGEGDWSLIYIYGCERWLGKGVNELQWEIKNNICCLDEKEGWCDKG